MHWLLSVPDTFSLREVIRRSGWRLIPSLHAKTMGDHLYRVEELGGSTVKLDIYQAPAGLVVQTDHHLVGSQVEEASRKVWRMLRLDGNLQPFLRMAAYTDGLRLVRRNGARILRGTGLFEDVVTAMLATWDAAGEPDFARVAIMVDRLGLPLSRNPTLHALPDPERVYRGSGLLDELFGHEVALGLSRAAAQFRAGGGDAQAFLGDRRPLRELRRDLNELYALSEPALSLLMLDLGRYDHIPTDEAAVRRYQRVYGGDPDTVASDLRAFFGRFQPWGGLAFWLWDWSRAPTVPAG